MKYPVLHLRKHLLCYYYYKELIISSLCIKRSLLPKLAKFACSPPSPPLCIIPFSVAQTITSSTLPRFQEPSILSTQAKPRPWERLMTHRLCFGIMFRSLKSPNRDSRSLGFKPSGSFGVKENLIPIKIFQGRDKSFVICRLFCILLKFCCLLLKDELRPKKNVKCLHEQKLIRIEQHSI